MHNNDMNKSTSYVKGNDHTKIENAYKDNHTRFVMFNISIINNNNNIIILRR